MQGSSALIRSHLHLFFYLISAAVGTQVDQGWQPAAGAGGRAAEEEKPKRKRELARAEGAGRARGGFSRCGGRLLRDSHINWIVARSKCM